MIGVYVNTLFVILGSFLGLLLRKGIPESSKNIIMVALGLFTCMLGITMGLQMKQALIVILSLIVGGVLGEVLKIEESLEALGMRLRNLTKTGEATSFAQGFVTASLLFCVGPMAILGSLQAGIDHNPELLFVKSLMDGVSSIILCSTFGIGVLFSALTLLLYQGLLVLFAQQLSFLTSAVYLHDFNSVGGIVILGLGIRLLGIKQIKVGNFLPALVFVILFIFVFQLF